MFGDDLLESGLLILREMENVCQTRMVVSTQMEEVNAAREVIQTLSRSTRRLRTTKLGTTDTPRLQLPSLVCVLDLGPQDKPAVWVPLA